MPDRFPPNGSTWMRDHLSWIKDLPIGEVLSMPGSHDAGMHKMVHSTMLANEAQVLTQYHSIYDQLQYGTRWFDLRPMLWNGDFWSGHASGTPVGWQGGLGEKIDDIIGQVNQFTETNKELIVLRVSHIHDFDTGDHITYEQQKTLLRKLYDGLRHVRKAPSAENVLDQKPDKYIGTNECVILFTNAMYEGNVIDDRVYGDIGRSVTSFSQHSESCNYTQSTLDGFLTSGFFSAISGGARYMGVREATLPLQDRGFRAMPQHLVCRTGGANLSKKGIVFQSDCIRDDAPLTMCIAASRVQWKTATAGNQSGQVVVAYGGKLIQDEGFLAKIRGLIEHQRVFKIENSLFAGEDPWEGTRKSCCIFWSESRPQAGGDGLLWRGMWAREGDEIDFSTTILSIWWHNNYLREDNFRDAYAALLMGKYGEMGFQINIAADGGMRFLKPDPEEGVKKRLVMRYKSLGNGVIKDRNIYENRRYNLQRDIDWIRYHDQVLNEQPGVYQQFFDRVDGESGALIKVINELFEIRDPAVGSRKRATMSLRSGPGRDTEKSAWEGDNWNVYGLL